MLRRRGYTDLTEALTVLGVEQSADSLLSKFKKLIQKINREPEAKLRLKTVLSEYGKDIVALANSISTKRTVWQKVRGY